MSGIGDITIGDTICAPDCVEPIEFVKISAPTMEMTFSVNDSPFAGREGKFVTSRQLRDRLFRETLKDVSLRVSETDGTDAFNVAGRGEMSLSILIETMRREGYEFQVSPAPGALPGDRRRQVRAHRAAGGGRARRLRGRGHREARLPQGRPGGDDPRGRPDEDRVPGPLPGPVRLPQRVFDRHQGRGHHGQRLRLLRPLSRATSAAGAPAP